MTGMPAAIAASISGFRSSGFAGRYKDAGGLLADDATEFVALRVGS